MRRAAAGTGPKAPSVPGDRTALVEGVSVLRTKWPFIVVRARSQPLAFVNDAYPDCSPLSIDIRLNPVSKGGPMDGTNRMGQVRRMKTSVMFPNALQGGSKDNTGRAFQDRP